MKTNKILVSWLVMSLALIWASTFAFKWNPWLENPNCTDTIRHEQVQKMIESKDYSSFKELFADKPMIQKINTEEKFQKRVALQNASKLWDTATVQKLKTELSLWQRKMDGTWNRSASWKWMWMWRNQK